MAEEKPKIDVVYLGRRTLASGKVGYAFIPLAKLEDQVRIAEATPRLVDIPSMNTESVDRAASLFEFKKIPCHSIGGIYETVGELDEGSGRLKMMGGAQFKGGRLNDECRAYIAAWRAMDEAYERHKKQKYNEKNAKGDLRLEEAVKIVKDRYRKVPAGYRRSFRDWLMDELEKR